MRNPAKEEELDKVDNVSLLPLDVTDLEQVKSCAESAIGIGPIDVVFNNAGYGLVGPFEGASDDQLIRQLNTNLLGVMRVTQAFIPHFREKSSGLFITTTSIGGLVTFPFNSVYHATKWGLEGWSESLAFELNPHGIGVKTVSPGGITTDFGGRSLDTTSHEAYNEAMQKVWGAFMDPERQKGYSTAEQIADVVFEAATDGKNTLRYPAGQDAVGMYSQRNSVGDERFREGVRQMFLA